MSLNSDSSYKKKDYFKKQTDKTNKQTLITLSLNSDSSSDQKEKRNKQTIAKKGHTANAHLPRRGFEVWEILSNVCFHKVSEFHDSSDFWQIGWLDTLYCTRGRNFQSLTKMGFLCNDFVKSTFACKGRVPKKKRIFYGLLPNPPSDPPPRPGMVFLRIKNYPYFSFGNKITNGWNKFYVWSHSKIWFFCSLI